MDGNTEEEEEESGRKRMQMLTDTTTTRTRGCKQRVVVALQAERIRANDAQKKCPIRTSHADVHRA